jgi:hypothetical protein
MALHFSAFADLIARQVHSRLPAARYEPAKDPNGPARLSVTGAVVTMTREGAYWRVTFERAGQAVTNEWPVRRAVRCLRRRQLG